MSNKSKYKEASILLQDQNGLESSDPKKCANILSDTYSKIYTRGISSHVPPIKTPRVTENMADVMFNPAKVLSKL